MNKIRNLRRHNREITDIYQDHDEAADVKDKKKIDGLALHFKEKKGSF